MCKKMQVSFQPDKNNGHFAWKKYMCVCVCVCVYFSDNILLNYSKIRNVSEKKFYIKSNHTFYVPYSPHPPAPEECTIYENMCNNE